MSSTDSQFEGKDFWESNPSFEELVEHTRHPDPFERWAAVFELGELGDPRAVDRLALLSSDSDEMVREAAVAALSKLDADHCGFVLVPAHNPPGVRDPSDCDKWLVFCPKITSDTLLLYIREGGAYTLRCYGGRLGSSSASRHADGVHTAREFERRCKPELVVEVSELGVPVAQRDRWERIVSEYWRKYRAVASEERRRRREEAQAERRVEAAGAPELDLVEVRVLTKMGTAKGSLTGAEIRGALSDYELDASQMRRVHAHFRSKGIRLVDHR